MTIHIPDGGPPIGAQLEEDEFHMLWLVQRHRRTGKRQLWLLLSAALKNGLRIVESTPEERAGPGHESQAEWRGAHRILNRTRRAR